ncbi:hypothetical protein [Confluentibacter flavum]|uniref:DNA primase n=1 Tax=Confluentibacter flavum TaxID=1909700 RepID=A0A2N3HFB5_9FLAO|nr:hypothetical protein [Confluentibacter flavum]PKQ43671.1 hypothetical protein CSW08_16840 [Confluentibacter flavum]
MKNRNDNLKRVIVDFKKLTPEILALLVEKYPDGYDEDQIISFKNASNEIIEAVEVTTKDTKYLVKVSKKLAITMENYDEDDYGDFATDDPDAIQDPELAIEADDDLDTDDSDDVDDTKLDKDVDLDDADDLDDLDEEPIDDDEDDDID